MGDQHHSGISWLQLGVACVMTGAASIGIQNTLLSSRVSVESEAVYRENTERRYKDATETLNRRLAFLEASDLRMTERLDKHLDADLKEFGELDTRIRGAEIALARINGKRNAEERFKPLMPGLHDALRAHLTPFDPCGNWRNW